MLTEDAEITAVPTNATDVGRRRRPRRVVLILVALAAVGGAAASVAIRDDGRGGSGPAPEIPFVPFVVDDVPSPADGAGSVDG